MNSYFVRTELWYIVYTNYLVREVVGTNTASNHGIDILEKGTTSIALIRGSPDRTLSKKYVPPKSGYLLTKTHCGG